MLFSIEFQLVQNYDYFTKIRQFITLQSNKHLRPIFFIRSEVLQ